MNALNVQHIIDNGYVYKVDSSVYFDVGAFDGKNDHFYAKLEPNLKGNSRLLANSKELTKYKVKKLAKEYDVQKKLHEKYLVTQCLSL
ncbi:cysteinyl-tRNA synthetase [Coemansia sp. RSA 1878]|nr:cysteinyl-tRNA synthetase [Coemansia sp. RSA 1878]